MTDFEMRCSEKSVREYVRILMFGARSYRRFR